MDHIAMFGGDDETAKKFKRRWSDTKSYPLFVQTCEWLHEYVTGIGGNVNDSQLTMLGLYRCPDNNDVRVALTGRVFSHNDVEHMLCKVYLAGTRSKGTLCQSVQPSPWRNYCWPPKNRETVGSHEFMSVVKLYMIAEFEVSGDQLPELEQPFLL